MLDSHQAIIQTNSLKSLQWDPGFSILQSFLFGSNVALTLKSLGSSAKPFGKGKGTKCLRFVQHVICPGLHNTDILTAAKQPVEIPRRWAVHNPLQ